MAVTYALKQVIKDFVDGYVVGGVAVLGVVVDEGDFEALLAKVSGQAVRPTVGS